MSSKPKLVIWGASGQAMVVADIVRLRGDYELFGFLDDLHAERQGTKFCGQYVLGGREQLDALHDRGVSHMIMGFGDSEARLRLSELSRAKGYALATAIHPQAVVAAYGRVGAGSVIKAGAAVDPAVTIGENAIVGAGVSLGHHCTLEDGARVNGGASLGGYVTVGRASMVGTGASVRDRIRIGKNSIIGAGSAVVRDIPDGVVAYGVPARVIRRNSDKPSWLKAVVVQ